MNPALGNTTALAYIGDAVYELYIRENIIKSGQTNADIMHRISINYVSAEAQANTLKKIYDALKESERELVRRARNHKISSKPKNAAPVDYKLATAFEALIGYLYMSGDKERMDEVLSMAAAAADKAGKNEHS